MISTEQMADPLFPIQLSTMFLNKGSPVSFEASLKPVLNMGENADFNIFPHLLKVVITESLEFSQRLRMVDPWNQICTEEASSIHAYTKQHGPYYALNKIMREGNIALLKNFVDYIWLMMNCLSKCPKPEYTTIYRGVPEDLSADYAIGHDYIWTYFSSCSLGLGPLQTPMFVGNRGQRTLFIIYLKSNRARSIAFLSASEGEKEVLLPPNTRLKVIDIADFGHGLRQIILKELPCQNPILTFPDEASPLQTGERSIVS